MNYKGIPHDLNVEILLDYLNQEHFQSENLQSFGNPNEIDRSSDLHNECKVEFKGHHKRNAYNDVVNIEELWSGGVKLTLSRNSIYNILPETLFHPIDRFNNIPEKEKKKRMQDEFDKEEREKDRAYRFFAPIDAILLQQRINARNILKRYIEQNGVLQRILCDSLSSEQKNNSFIRQILPVLPYCKYIRGDKTLITIMLRKVLTEEELTVEIYERENMLTDIVPHYDCSVGDSLDTLYAGNSYMENVLTYDIRYWSDDRCDENFLNFIDELEILREFIRDWFLSVEEDIVFDVVNYNDTVILSDSERYNYLNYNTNL